MLIQPFRRLQGKLVCLELIACMYAYCMQTGIQLAMYMEEERYCMPETRAWYGCVYITIVVLREHVTSRECVQFVC